MELNGTVYRVLAPVKGQSARGEWTKQEIVIEMADEFNRKVCISFWGDRVQDIAQMREGDRVSISVNIESREYNGRWFTEVRAWKVNRQPDSAGQQARQVPPADMPPITAESFEGGSSAGEADDLPF